MESSAPSIQNSSSTPTQNITSTPVPKSPKSWVKYLVIEVGIVVLIIIAVAVYVLKPYSGLSMPKSKKVPVDMTKSVDSNGKASKMVMPVVPPTAATIRINENGFEPTVASSSGQNVLLQFVNNTVMPVEIVFTGNTFTPIMVGPNISSQPLSIIKAGEYEFSIKDTTKTGKIIIK